MGAAVGTGSPQLPSLDIVFESARDLLKSQQAYAGTLDAKAGFVLGSATLLTGVVVQWREPQNVPTVPFLGDVVGKTFGQALPFAVHTLPFFAIACYLLVVITAYKAYRLYRFAVVPKDADTLNAMAVMPAHDTK